MNEEFANMFLIRRSPTEFFEGFFFLPRKFAKLILIRIYRCLIFSQMVGYTNVLLISFINIIQWNDYHKIFIITRFKRFKIKILQFSYTLFVLEEILSFMKHSKIQVLMNTEKKLI